MQPEFTVVQNEVDVQVLHSLKEYFGCGSVAVNRKDKYGVRYHYRVKSIKDLNEKILPFFLKHSLKTKKKIEFSRFRKIIRLMHDGYHRESLKNFLEVYDKGQQLRERIREKTGSRGDKVLAVVAQLREKLSQDPDFK